MHYSSPVVPLVALGLMLQLLIGCSGETINSEYERVAFKEIMTSDITKCLITNDSRFLVILNGSDRLLIYTLPDLNQVSTPDSHEIFDFAIDGDTGDLIGIGVKSDKGKRSSGNDRAVAQVMRFKFKPYPVIEREINIDYPWPIYLTQIWLSKYGQLFVIGPNPDDILRQCVWQVGGDFVIIKKLIEIPDSVCSFAICPDGNTIISGHHEFISAWSLINQKCIWRYDWPKLNIITMDISRDGGLLAAGEGNVASPGEWLKTDIKIFDLNGYNYLKTLSYHKMLCSIKFSNDGKILATGDYRGNVVLWDTRKWGRVMEVNLKYPPTSIQFSADGIFFVTAGGGEGANEGSSFIEVWKVKRFINAVHGTGGTGSILPPPPPTDISRDSG